MQATDLTVAAIIEHEGKYLLVEERAMGNRVISQPGGHIEADESPEQAVVREALEETGSTVECNELVGIYLWIHPQTRQQYLRIIYSATFIRCDETLPLDSGIIARRWMSLSDVESRRHSLRSPVVLRCLHDYVKGNRASDQLLSGMLPLQHNVNQVLASANLV